MNLASSSALPLTWLSLIRSEPARSTRLSSPSVRCSAAWLGPGPGSGLGSGSGFEVRLRVRARICVRIRARARARVRVRPG